MGVLNTVATDYCYSKNPFQNGNTPFLAYVSHIDYDSQCIYLQPDSHIQSMQQLTEQLE